jgi:N-acetylglucosamine-6-sulfatase
MRLSVIIPSILLLLLGHAGPVSGQDALVSQPAHSLKLLRTSDGRPRNIIFILTDDHRYDALGFLKSQPFIKTPNLDRLAREGAYLKNAFVTTSLCSPSRASILTGLYAHKHKVVDNNNPVPKDLVFFPQYMQQIGYQTALVGKWHMGGDFDDPQRGFDYWVSFKGQGSYLPEKNGLNVNGKHVPQKGYITDELTDYALDFLKSRDRNKPFMLYLSHKAVHADFIPADRNKGMFKGYPFHPPLTMQAGTQEGAPMWVQNQRNSWHGVEFPYHSSLDIGEYYRRYAETLYGVDESVGRIMAYLKEQGLLESTLIIYMGDNGFQFGEHGLIDKRTAYEASMRVPMLAWCPELIKPGTVVKEVVANIDIAPTLLDAAGLRAPDYMDGKSFLPLLEGKKEPWRDGLLYEYYWERNYPQTPTMHAIRGDRYKYIHYNGIWDTDELYDLQNDPLETRNLIRDKACQDIVKKMNHELFQQLEESKGMYIPLNPDRGEQSNLRNRYGSPAAAFPDYLLRGDTISAFPATIQLSPADSGKQRPAAMRESIDDIIKKGFGHFWVYGSSADANKEALDYAESRGMYVDYMTSGFEGFDRDHPPVMSVYDPQYASEVQKRVAAGLAPMKALKRVYAVFPFQDEPFHAGASAFDYSSFARAEFAKRYGYTMPDSLGAVKNDPKKWVDLLNFQSGTFSDGWKKVYDAVKAFDPRPGIVMTHDSHNTFGAGVKSNSKIAMDDVFHWGGDFADILAYDIYPYMTFDYRYGEPGRLRKPRISQMHYTIAQLRNVCTTYGKQMGFWVGTYSDNWFQRFKGPERKSQYWSEHEMAYTAIAQGANFLISPSNYNTTDLPLDSMHWADYGKAMSVIQQAGPGLLKAPRVKARAAFLFPRSQYLLLREEYFNVGLTYEAFLRAFGELDILHEDQITDDKLDGYRVLVLADVKLLPAKVAGYIASFVRNGGIVIADCVPNMDDRKRPLEGMATLFGVSHAATDRVKEEGQWVPFSAIPPKMSFPPAGKASAADEKEARTDRVEGTAFQQHFVFPVVSPHGCEVKGGRVVLKMRSGRPALMCRQTGKGKTWLFGFSMQDTYFNTWKNKDSAGRQELEDLIGDVFRESKIQAHINSSNPDIEASVRANSNEGYVFVINHEAVNPGTTVRIADLNFKLAISST